MKKLKFYKNWRSITIAVTIALFSSLFIAFDDTDDFELAKNMDIYHTLVRELRLFYVDEIDIPHIFQESIDDMLQSLDPYTVYYPESELEEYRFMTTGQYGGIGALMQTDKNGNIIIVEIYEKYPADKAGLKVGDIIKKVGDQKANSDKYDDISVLIKGVPNTELNMTVFRPGDNKEYTKTLIRERIHVENVPYYGMLADSTGYIKLTGFTQTAYAEVKDALLKLKEQDANKIILDLRNNPGGLLMEAVKIVSLFVETGTSVVSTKGKMKQWNNNFATTTKPVDLEIPVAVLVSRNSASASEIVSGALQDLDRAVVVGERTFGKGLVQTTRDLSYNSKLKITTAKYYIPSGRCIQALDYTHRNPDGSVGYVPDSLITEFKTCNGRKVYDGGGVSPDVSVSESDVSPVTQHLFTDLVIFDFVTEYVAKMDSIADAKTYRLSDSEFDKFVDFAVAREISYKTDSERQLEKLIATTKKEKYFTKVEAKIQDLISDLKPNVKKDILYFQEDIKRVLETEICKRYFYRKGAIINSLSDSEIIDTSIEILSNKDKYNSLLQPK